MNDGKIKHRLTWFQNAYTYTIQQGESNLELAVRWSAMTFLRLCRQNSLAMFDSLCEKLENKR